MGDTLWDFVQDFVIITTAIEQGKKLIGWLKKQMKFSTNLKLPRKRRLK